MAAKSNNPDLGHIECDGCGSFAAIRRQRTGKQYLYLHCTNCGMDKRSGAKLQAKWERAITENNSEIPENLNTPAPSAAHAEQPVKTSDTGEWLPPEIRLQKARNDNHEIKTSTQGENDDRASEPAQRIDHEENNTSASNGGFGVFILGAFAGLAAIAGIRASTA